MTQAQAQKEMTVIITKFDFRVENFLDETDNKRKDFIIEVRPMKLVSYSRLPNEHDHYTIDIYELRGLCKNEFGGLYEDRDFVSALIVDSKGNIVTFEDEECNYYNRDTLTGIEKEVINILYHRKNKGLLTLQDIDCSSGIKREVDEVDFILCNYPVKKGMVANPHITTYVDEKPRKRNDWFSLFIADWYMGTDSVVRVLNSPYTVINSHEVAQGRGTKLYKEIMKILKDDEVQGIIRPIVY